MLSKEVIKEVKKMLLYMLVFVAVMIGVFSVFGYYGSSVIFGGLLGGAVAFLNFLFLAFAVEKSVKGDNSPKGVMMSSYSLRLVFIAIVVVIAIKSPYINYVAVVIPLIFPRIIIMLDNLLNNLKKRNKNERS